MTKKKNENMLLYNENFSVCPVTTHIEINKVEKNISKLKIYNTIHNIINFYNKILKKKIKIILLGLNPHASKDLNKNSIDIKLLTPLVKRFKKKLILRGQFLQILPFDVQRVKFILECTMIKY